MCLGEIGRTASWGKIGRTGECGECFFLSMNFVILMTLRRIFAGLFLTIMQLNLSVSVAR